METQDFILLAVVLLCLGLSFLLSGMETGVFALNRLRIRQLKRAGNKRAELLYRYLERPEDFLWTILVGNTATNFVIYTIAAMTLHDWLTTWRAAFFVCFFLAIFLFYALCELLPKMLFQLFPNRLCLLAATPFRVIHLVFQPLAALAAKFSRVLLRWTGGKRFTGYLFGNREELRSVMHETGQNLTSEERAMIDRVLDLQNHTLRAITRPLAQTVTVTTATPLSEVFQIAREKHFTRLPVFEAGAGTQRITGFISLKELLYREKLDLNKTAGDFLNPALYLDEHLRLEEALRRMQRSGRRLAVVLGRERTEIGIVTLHDILRFIFGEVSL
jgi:CBS domain containing-hemolysin-like protein